LLSCVARVDLLNKIAHPSLAIGPLLETRKHEIGDILRESIEHESKSLALYHELLSLVQGESVMLEEYARKMIFEEEQHLGEVDKMLRQPGDIHSVASPEAAAIVPTAQVALDDSAAGLRSERGRSRQLAHLVRGKAPRSRRRGRMPACSGGQRRRNYEFCGSKFARCLGSPNHLEREPVTARTG
jgi:hypothetical protein